MSEHESLRKELRELFEKHGFDVEEIKVSRHPLHWNEFTWKIEVEREDEVTKKKRTLRATIGNSGP